MVDCGVTIIRVAEEGCGGLTTAHEKVVGVSLWVIERCPHAGGPRWCGIRGASNTALVTLFIRVFVTLGVFGEFLVVVHPRQSVGGLLVGEHFASVLFE